MSKRKMQSREVSLEQLRTNKYLGYNVVFWEICDQMSVLVWDKDKEDYLITGITIATGSDCSDLANVLCTLLNRDLSNYILEQARTNI